MNFKLLFVLFLLVLPLSFSSLIGQSYLLSDMNSFKGDIENNYSCSTFSLSETDFAALKNSEGILALDLYFKFTPEISSNSYLQIYVNGDLIKFKTKVGLKSDKYVIFEDFQSGRDVIFLEDYRDQNKLDLNICGYVSGSVYELEMLNNSSVGSFKMPYFSCKGCFSKSLDNDQFLVDDIVKTNLFLLNKGFDSVNTYVKYNFFDVNTETKMLGGEVFFNGLIEANKDKTITYYFKSKTDKYFLIPPASLEYFYDGFKFRELSNPIVANAKNYLDDIDCELASDKIEYVAKDDVKITVSCYNKSAESKVFNLAVKINDTNLINSDVVIDSKKLAEFTASYSFEDFEKKSACGQISFNDEIKDLGCYNFYFSESSSNYTYYLVGFIFLIIVGIFIYYWLFL